jgi:hypothetical protein
MTSEPLASVIERRRRILQAQHTFKVLPSEILDHECQHFHMKIKPGFSADTGVMTFSICASYSVNKLATLTQALTTPTHSCLKSNN